MIQCRFRQRKATQRHHMALMTRNAANKIQNKIRIKQATEKTNIRRVHRDAATKLQSLARKRAAKEYVDQKRKRLRGALLIQVIFRAFNAIRKQKASTIMQCCMRKFKAVKVTTRKRLERDSAIVMQCFSRCTRAKRRANQKRRERDAATCINRYVRGRLGRNERRRRIASIFVTKIQTLVRIHQAYKRLCRLEEEKILNKLKQGRVKIDAKKGYRPKNMKRMTDVQKLL
jgi:hypothetical protein